MLLFRILTHSGPLTYISWFNATTGSIDSVDKCDDLLSPGRTVGFSLGTQRLSTEKKKPSICTLVAILKKEGLV